MISKEEAKAKGLSRFFNGEFCARGHLSERYVLNRGCVDCQKENLGKWRLSKPERAKELATTHSRKRYLLKRDLVLQEQSAWRRNNEQSVKASRKKSYENGGKEKRIAYNLEYQKKNPEKVKQWRLTWLAQNPDTKNAARRRYQAQKVKAMPSWADAEAIKQFYALAVLLSKETGVSHHVDHIIPIRGKYVCGLHVEHNLQVITWLENTRKGNKVTPECGSSQAIDADVLLDK